MTTSLQSRRGCEAAEELRAAGVSGSSSAQMKIVESVILKLNNHTAKRPIRWHIYHYLTSPLGIVIIKQMCENLQNLLSVGDGRTEVLEHAAKKGNGTIGTVCVWHCINSRTLTMRCGCQATIRSRSACMGRSHSPLKSNNGLARRGPSPHPTTHPHPAGLCACLMVATCVSVCLSLPHTASPLQPTWASVY